MRRVHKAGGIVVRFDNGQRRYLLVTAKKHPRHWVFPKGTVERGIGQSDTRWVQVVGVLAIAYGLAYALMLAGFDYRPPRPEEETEKYRKLFYDGKDLRTARVLISDAAVRAAALSFAWAFQISDFLYWREVVTGAAVTMVAASAWWRISTTHRSF